MVDLNTVLEKYDKRVNIIGSYFLLSSAVLQRKKYEEFTDEEFYNLIIQTVCFIFNKSLRRENCFKEDIRTFIEEANILIYKKPYTLEKIEELTSYMTEKLTYRGKTFYYPYYSIEDDNTVYKEIRIVETDKVTVDGKEKLAYKLTTEGYRLLLATKEYDELFQIHISQTLARLRLSMDDYDGAKHEVYDIINSLEIQYQKIDNFIKSVRTDIAYMENQSYVGIVEETLNTLIEQMDRYDELKNEANMKIQDKTSYLESDDGILEDRIKAIEKSLKELHDFIGGIEAAKQSSVRLIARIQKFEREHKEILEHLLRVPVLKKFSFKEEILDKLEGDVNLIEAIRDLYIPLFKCRVNNLFNVNVPYGEQTILTENKEDIVVEDNAADYEAINDIAKEEMIRFYEDIYYTFFKNLMLYAKETKDFTLKEFLKSILTNNRTEYLTMTQNAYVFRNTVMYFALIENNIVISNIFKSLRNINFSPDTELQIERLFERLYNEDRELAEAFSVISTEKIIDDEFKVNTEIDIENLTARSMTLTNIRFNFKRRGE